MKLSDLALNPKNPRKITDEKLGQLKKALAAFGDLSGIVYNRRTKQLVGGHQRSKTLDPDSLIVITKKFDKPSKTGTTREGYLEVKGERFSFREVDWDVAREKAANIAANKGAGQWDLPQLNEWLKELSSFDLDFDLSLTMFDDDELKEIAGIVVKEHTRTGVTGKDEDDVPERAPARTKLGDVYTLGQHRLMCGDSTDDAAVSKLMNGQIADVCFTSPPYNAGTFEPGGDVIKNHLAKQNRAYPKMVKKYENSDDDLSDEDYFNLVERALLVSLKFAETSMFNISLLSGCKASVMKLLGKYVGNFKEIIYWNKRSSTPHIVKGILTMVVEPIFCFGTSNSRKFPKGSFKGNLSNLIEGSNAGGDNVVPGKHSATFPVYLPEHIINNFTEKSVLDLFGGTGTTMIAAEKTKRKCFMMELDPHYCDIIVKRWEEYTGKTADRIPAPKTITRPANSRKPAQQLISNHAKDNRAS